MTRPLHVLIAGAGLSGLALAQGLRQAGHEVQVFERDADLNRKQGYYLHLNPFGGEALRQLLPADLYELYVQTSRSTYDRRESIVLDDQLREITSMPHLGPPNDGEWPHTGVHRRTLRQILSTRLGGALRTGTAVVSYVEDGDGVTATLSDGSTVRGDVLVGADGINSAVRAQRLPEVSVIPTGIEGIGVYGRTILTPELSAAMPDILHQGVLIAADRKGSRLLLGSYEPRRAADEAARAIAPDAQLDPVPAYVMVSCSVAPGTVVPPNREWTSQTPAMLRESMLRAIEGWHPVARRLVSELELDSIFSIPFGFLQLIDDWAPSRVTMVGDAAHAMLPTIGMGANLALRDAGRLCDELVRAARDGTDLVAAIGAYERDMREVVYPFHRMTLSHDRTFGGGGLEQVTPDTEH